MTVEQAPSGTLITGAVLVDPVDGLRRADILLRDGVIAEIGEDLPAEGAQVVSAEGRYLLPGSIDAHSHGDSEVLEDQAQLGLLRQGVTTIIAGQDGVSYAPGDHGAYGSDYFGPVNGTLELPGPRVSDLLEHYAGATRLSVGYLVPAGTVRHTVMGNSEEAPTPAELEQMQQLVAEGMDDGALGLSTGLDYVPGCFASAEELAALCRPVAKAGGLYVSHMRAYGDRSRIGVGEMIEIAEGSGVDLHVSHFSARSAIIAEQIEAAAARGHQLSFDAYPYFRTSTLLSMLLLEQSFVAQGPAAAAAALYEPETRTAMRRRWARRWEANEETEQQWGSRVQVARAGHPDWAWAEGKTIDVVAGDHGAAPLETAMDLLAGTALRTTAVHRLLNPRDDADLARTYALPGATVGSDGIFHGAASHPRGCGTFARVYRRYVIDRGDFGWDEMAMIASARPAQRYGLTDRGRIAPGYRADVVLLDPEAFADRAWYAGEEHGEGPLAHAVGVERVYVAGVEVLGPQGLSPGGLSPAHLKPAAGPLPGGPARPAPMPR